jgi:hypothetical protein
MAHSGTSQRLDTSGPSACWDGLGSGVPPRSAVCRAGLGAEPGQHQLPPIIEAAVGVAVGDPANRGQREWAWPRVQAVGPACSLRPGERDASTITPLRLSVRRGRAQSSLEGGLGRRVRVQIGVQPLSLRTFRLCGVRACPFESHGPQHVVVHLRLTTTCCGSTAYRIPGETSHASQPRTASTSKKRMRHMRQNP